MTIHHRTKTFAALVCAVVAVSSLRVEAAIVAISKPVDSNDGRSRPVADGVWSVSVPPEPLATSSGIGYIVNPHYVLDETLDVTVHDHQYLAPYIPDPSRGVVTFAFDEPTVVKSIRVIQHGNGVTRLEGFIGESLATMTSVGSALGGRGDITGSYVFAEGEESIFTFTNNRPAPYFRFVICKTSLDVGYAFYRAFLRDENGQVIPPSGLVLDIQVSAVALCWPSKSDRTYQVESMSPWVNTGAWQSVGMTVQGNGRTKCITNDILGRPPTFYRVKEVP